MSTCGKDILSRSRSHARETSLLQLIEDKLSGIGKGGEDNDLLVFGFLLLVENSHKFFQLQVFLLASLIVSSKSLEVLVDFLQFIDIHLQISDETTQVLHIRKFYGSLTEGISLVHQVIDFLIIKICITFSSTSRDSSIATFFLELQGKFQGAFMHIEYLLHRSHARIPGTFQTLHKQDTHHLDQKTFAVYVVIPILSRSLSSLFLIHFEIKTWLIGGKAKFIELLINFFRGLQLA